MMHQQSRNGMGMGGSSQKPPTSVLASNQFSTFNGHLQGGAQLTSASSHPAFPNANSGQNGGVGGIRQLSSRNLNRKGGGRNQQAQQPYPEGVSNIVGGGSNPQHQSNVPKKQNRLYRSIQADDDANPNPQHSEHYNHPVKQTGQPPQGSGSAANAGRPSSRLRAGSKQGSN